MLLASLQLIGVAVIQQQLLCYTFSHSFHFLGGERLIASLIASVFFTTLIITWQLIAVHLLAKFS